MFCCSALWQFFRVVAHCCPQLRKMLHVVAYNADLFPRCRQQRRKVLNFRSGVFFRVVAYNAKTWSVLLARMRKNV
jgi:hypothetical protein